MKQLSERDIEILFILVRSEINHPHSIFNHAELSHVYQVLQSQSEQLTKQKETSQASLATRIDNQIYNIVKSEFSNCRLIAPTLTVQKMIQGYERWGQHKIDFNKIYDL